MNAHSQRGSAIIMLFVAVALFGLLAYAFLKGSRGNLSMMTDEAAKVAGYQSTDCSNAVSMATKRLEARGCAGMISTLADGSNTNPGAPTDGSCSVYHPNGGGVNNCTGAASPVGTPPDPEDCLDTLAVGQSCVNAAYAGEVGGVRIYADLADLASTTWNNGSGTMPNIPTATSNTDGMANTDAILAVGSGSPYRAAENCRALGPDWYLPAPAELQLLEDVKNVGVFNGTFYTSGGGASRYWSSRQVSSDEARAVRLVDGSTDSRDKDESLRVRCVRRR